jgi:hypothetical protein
VAQVRVTVCSREVRQDRGRSDEPAVLDPEDGDLGDTAGESSGHMRIDRVMGPNPGAPRAWPPISRHESVLVELLHDAKPVPDLDHALNKLF